VVDLNRRLKDMELADAKAEVEFNDRLEQAVIDAKASVLEWKTNVQAAPLVKGDCTLDDSSIRRIRSIVKGQ
jgi:hypothetical protein